MHSQSVSFQFSVTRKVALLHNLSGLVLRDAASGNHLDKNGNVDGVEVEKESLLDRFLVLRRQTVLNREPILLKLSDQIPNLLT